MRILRRWILITLIIPVTSWAQNTPTPNSEKSFEGDAALLTNYVWHGLTQTQRNPAIQTSIFYHLGPNLKLGAWGSNVSYYNRSKANALLKFLMDINLPISPNFNFTLHYSDNHYFESDDRDGNAVGFEVLTFGYSILIEQEGNWQGQVSKARYYSVGKTWDVFGRWKWANQVGYTHFETLPNPNYFDFRSGLGVATGSVFWEGALTFTNDNSAHGSFADYFIILSAKAKF